MTTPSPERAGGGGIEFDRSVVGVDVEVGSMEVTREHIARYCDAVSEDNPLYTDEAFAAAGPHGGIIAPPGLLPTIPTQGGLDPKVKFGNTTFASGVRLEMYAPVRPGDTITVRSQIKEVYPKTGRTGTMVFVVRRTSFRNQHGVDVGVQEFSAVHRQVERI